MKMKFALMSCVVLALAALLATPALAQGNCMALGGIIAAHYEFGGLEGDGWYGTAYLTLGKDPTILPAKLVDLNSGSKDHPFKANFAGDEILTFTIEGRGSFKMSGHFICVAGSGPYFCGFSEEGKLVPDAGTGEYAGMTGNISSHGSAVFGWEPTTDNPWIWISQLTGSVCK